MDKKKVEPRLVSAAKLVEAPSSAGKEGAR